MCASLTGHRSWALKGKGGWLAGSVCKHNFPRHWKNKRSVLIFIPQNNHGLFSEWSFLCRVAKYRLLQKH